VDYAIISCALLSRYQLVLVAFKRSLATKGTIAVVC